MKLLHEFNLRTIFCLTVIVAQQCCHGYSLYFKRVSNMKPKTFMSVTAAPFATVTTPSDVTPYIPAPVVAILPELRAPKDLFNNVVNIGATKAKLSPLKIFLLGIKSGCHISFGALLMLSVGGLCPGIQASNNPGLLKIIYGCFGLPIGLLMTLVCGGELFTGNTLFLVTAVLEKRATMKELFKNWSLSYLGNTIGSLLMVWLTVSGGTLGTSPAAAQMAVTKCALPWGTAFVRGVMGNWLVCMSILMATGSSSLASKMVAIFFPISAFVMIGLEHSIANLYIIPLGIMRGGGVSWRDFLMKNLLPVTLGNIFAGAVVVGLSYTCIHGSLLDKKAKDVVQLAV